MKKTIIALMAMSSVASADTTWAFDGDLTSTGTNIISTSATEAYSTQKEQTNEQGETTITTEWGRRGAEITYIDSGLATGTVFGNYVLDEDKGKAVDLTTISTGGIKWLSLNSNYYAGGDGKLVVGSTANTNFTIMAYVKFDNINTSGEQFIFGTGGNNQVGIAFGLQNGKLDILRKYKAHDNLTTMDVLEADVWYHLAVSYTAATNSAEFFVNGDSVGSLTLDNSTAGFNTPSTNVGAAIGAGAQDTVKTGDFHGPQGGLDGYLAEVKVFNSTLTQGQILAEANLIPEPTTATLSLLALAGLAARRRRK